MDLGTKAQAFIDEFVSQERRWQAGAELKEMLDGYAREAVESHAWVQARRTWWSRLKTIFAH